MAVSILKSYIYRGTSLTNDLFNRYGSRGLMVYETTGHTDVSSDLDAGQDEVIASGDALFAGTTMPMSKILKSEFINDEVCKHYVEYKFFPRDNPDPTLFARFRTGHVGIKVYRTSAPDVESKDLAVPDAGGPHFGGPGGGVTARIPEGVFPDTASWNNGFIKNATHAPQPYTFNLPAFTITLWSTLSTNPIATVAPFIDTANSDTVVFGNMTFPINTVRFDGAEIDWFQQAGTDMFSVQYQFTHVATGFYNQRCWFKPSLGRWITQDAAGEPASFVYTNHFPLVAYTGAFPI